MSSIDVIVVGAGICGAAAAHFLAGRGREVLVIDRAGIAEESSSRGEGNVLVCDKPSGPERELALHGRALWESLGERLPAGRVTRTGALVLSRETTASTVSTPPAAILARVLAPGSARELDPGPARELDPASARELEPALAPQVRAVHEPGDLMVDAPGMARALLAGLEVRTGTQVAAVAAGEVTLAGGERITAGQVVICAGPWSRALTGLPIEPRKGQLVALAVDPSRPALVRHKLIEASYAATVAAPTADLQLASVIEPTLDGDEILVGSSRQRVGFDLTVDDVVTRAMLARAAGWVPALRELTVTRAWAGLRPWLPDRLPAVGRLGGGVWTSTGHEGSGVCLGPVSGLLLAQLMCGEQPLVDPGPFDPCRFDRIRD